MRIRTAVGAVAPVLLLLAALCPDARAATGTLTVEYERCREGTGTAGIVCLRETVRQRTENPQAGTCVELLTGRHATIRRMVNGTNSRATFYADTHCSQPLGGLAPRAAIGNVAARSVRFAG
ncbi:hypothetical protein [Streptomyces sp. UNOC14_S4]|uniref:hypothetical protein n=1 Tax=Streptomyces sp. UNOC14_S4 TaxID=2872340 RepID=UPI001E2A6A1A|nr:hypothetical protein [Streptomyces sp. UNOC14_S4]MCC3770084.1 hypothetical protein [Streptomyces sp. UNOC14_S4]